MLVNIQKSCTEFTLNQLSLLANKNIHSFIFRACSRNDIRENKITLTLINNSKFKIYDFLKLFLINPGP